MKEYCNPLNLNYKYQHYGSFAHREGADPTLVRFRGKYLLFVSMSAGFYYSDDLANWQWHENRSVDLYRYAPDARPIGDWLYFCASESGEPSTIWRTRDPLSDEYEKVSEPFPFWDPALFCDDDGRVYLYWGSSNEEPIWGVELDPETMTPLGEKVGLIFDRHDSHGWERFNYPGRQPIDLPFTDHLLYHWYFLRHGKPFLEGPFLNKWNGKYYLQYAAPDTEAPIYCDGYYVSDSPLGPFRSGDNSPFCQRLGGFISGSGHGSTVEDESGNLWHVSSMCVCVNKNFERRVGLFPAGLDQDGLLYCNQHFADYPVTVPEGRFVAAALTPRYMLLSYRKPVRASSSVKGHAPELAVDESIRTSWCAEGCKGEWLELDLGQLYEPHSVQINFADVEVPCVPMPPEACGKEGPVGGRWIDSGRALRTRWLLEGSADGEHWFVLEDRSDAETDLSHPYLVLPARTRLRYLRLTGAERPYGSRLAVSGLRVFGLGDGEKPAAVSSPEARLSDGGMTCEIRWSESPSATGYNVRFGIAPDKLYSSAQVYGDTTVQLVTLNAGKKYYYAVDAFNENGVTPGSIHSMNQPNG